MAYDTKLADRMREYLAQFPSVKIEEKKMFRGLVFMVNGKMCINVSGENLMCRFDPALTKELSGKKGFLPMKMKGKEYLGYCYVVVPQKLCNAYYYKVMIKSDGVKFASYL